MEQVPDKSHRAFIYFFIVSLDSLSFCLIAPILAPLLSEHQLFFTAAAAYYYYGILIALFPLSYMIGAPLIGLWSDRWGRKPLLLVCLSLMLAAFVAYAYAFQEKSLSLLMLGRILAGLGAGSQVIAQAAMVDLATPREKPKAIAFIAIAMTLGLVFGPLLASQWSHTESRQIFVLVSALIVVNIVLLSCYKDFSRHDTKNSFSLKIKLKALIANRRLLSLLGIFFLFELGWSLYYQSLPLLLSFHWHLTNRPIGWISAYVGASLALFLCLGAKSSLLAPQKSKVPLALLLGAGAFFLPGIFSTLTGLIISALATVGAVAIIYPSLIAELSDVAQEHQGFIIGLSGSLLALAFAMTGFFSGFLVSLYDRLPLLVAALLWLLALISLHLLKGVKHATVS